MSVPLKTETPARSFKVKGSIVEHTPVQSPEILLALDKKQSNVLLCGDLLLLLHHLFLFFLNFCWHQIVLTELKDIFLKMISVT